MFFGHMSSLLPSTQAWGKYPVDMDSGIASARLYNIKGGSWHFSLPSLWGHVGQLAGPGGVTGERAEAGGGGGGRASFRPAVT